MMFAFAFGFAALPSLVAAQYLVDPPTTAAPDTIQDCTYWQVASAADTCISISDFWGLSLEQLYTYNPSLAEGCDLVVGNSYCIEENWGIPPPTSTTTTTTPTQSPTPTPTPTTALEACLAQAGGYSSYCPRCVANCQSSTDWTDCFYSVFFTINEYDSDCWEHGGVDCANQAADIVCPQT
ncbi:hypothetical protein BX600DRAFT_477875 [Xylariales sp. PMI_506]|nr:hypothetical protein BX600DRAFT_477875 [Xylariales sp. PMI_506]